MPGERRGLNNNDDPIDPTIRLVTHRLTHPQFDGCIGGLIAAFLLLAASFFVPTGLPLRELNVAKKAVFLLGGSLLALVVDISPRVANIDILYGLIIGSGWPYLILGIVAAVMTYAKGLAAVKAAQAPAAFTPGETAGNGGSQP